MERSGGGAGEWTGEGSGMADAPIPGTASAPAPEPVATLEAAVRILATANSVLVIWPSRDVP